MNNNNYFPVRYSQLNQDALKNELVNRYDFKEPLSCNLFRNGMNDVYIVKNEQAVYYLRISLAGMHEYIDYEEETIIINTFDENGVSVASPVRCKDTNFVWTIHAPEGTRFAVLFNEAKQEPLNDDIKKSYNIGYMTAQMHMISDEKNFIISRPPIDLVELIKNPLEIIHPYL
jgi:Ser/Thr protein kinase RdoA (MazF antagonist)